MSRKLITFLGILLICVPVVSSVVAKTYTIDIEKSTLHWTGSKKIGEDHQGGLKFKRGKLQSSGKSFKGTFVIDMNSIVCHDIKNLKENGKLVHHLKSKDFFYVKSYKTAKLVVQNFQKKKDNHYVVIGNITIRGITRKIKFPATIQFKKNFLHAKGILRIDRTRFDIKYNSGTFFKALGDKLINDEFILKFEIHSK